MKNVIIGTAGHIDHGKTALIRALTGRDTDRLKEEKERGITTDLGFTWFDLKDGTRCGIVDVPGHERFISNMTAGVVGMDLVLMVIAADEGIMPQTREHLDILELLGVRKTILVLNKCDLVEEEWLDMAEQEVKKSLKGTILEKAPLVRTSAVTGQGIERLKDVIEEMVHSEVPQRDAEGIPRLPVDRVFTLPGIGTVVTGTLIAGSITKDDVLEIYPQGKQCRIRNVQVHGVDVQQCFAGQRVALNIANLKKEEIQRGCVVAPAGSMKQTGRIDVKIKILQDSQRILKNRERLHFYMGTAELLCRAVLLGKNEIAPGQEGYAQMVLEENIVVKRGDRFVIRFYSPLETIGGGVVLEPSPGRHKRFDEEVIEDLRRKEEGSVADICEMQIRGAGQYLITLSELARVTSYSPKELAPWLDELAEAGTIYELEMQKDTYYWHREQALALCLDVERLLREYAARFPYRPGMAKAQLKSRCMKHMKAAVFDRCIAILEAEGRLRTDGEYICLPDRQIPRDETFTAVEKTLTDAFEAAGYRFLHLSEVCAGKWDEREAADILRVLIRDGRMVKIAEDVYTMKHFTDEAGEWIRKYFQEHEILTFTQIREHFDTNRKNAKLLAEYMDSVKITRPAGAQTQRRPGLHAGQSL